MSESTAVSTVPATPLVKRKQLKIYNNHLVIEVTKLLDVLAPEGDSEEAKVKRAAAVGLKNKMIERCLV